MGEKRAGRVSHLGKSKGERSDQCERASAMNGGELSGRAEEANTKGREKGKFQNQGKIPPWRPHRYLLEFSWNLENCGKGGEGKGRET